jgi:ABC-type antimicrobial peptide transport system permease subunit
MQGSWLIRASLRHYWRTNAAVVLGVATAVAVLAGSLLVGESVRASLARLAVARLGRVTEAVSSPRFFREALAAELATQAGFAERHAVETPLLALRGVVSRVEGGRRAEDVLVYGVDERFFRLHGVRAPKGLEGRTAVVSPALAAELRVQDGAALVVLLASAEAIPGSTLFGRRDEPGRRLRVTMAGVLDRAQQGEFSLLPTAQDVRALFVPLAALQRALALEGRVNTVLVSSAADDERGEGRSQTDGANDAWLAGLVVSTVGLDDLGLRLRTLKDRHALSLESSSGLLEDDTVAAARAVARGQGLESHEVIVYLANSILGNGRSVPYSLVAGLDPASLGGLTGREVTAAPGEPPPIVLDAWAAEDLGVSPGDPIGLDYYLWREEGRLVTERATFRLSAVAPLAGPADDRDLVPEYPGITTSAHLSDWDPPFPVDLSLIRPRDERYWQRYRATPKAFVPLAVGQRLWGHRQGHVTSLRLVPAPGTNLEEARATFEPALRSALVSGAGTEEGLRALGFAVIPVRAQALAAAKGTTDFGEYFVYFSFFLVAAALLLAGLFFRLGVEQRLREVGLLRAVGFTTPRLLALFVSEGLVLASTGALLGVAGAVMYARLIMWGLGTVWIGAVGTRELALHPSVSALVAGGLGGLMAALLAITWTVRDLGTRAPRALLAGSLEDWAPPPGRTRSALFPLALAAGALVLVVASAMGAVEAAVAFFGAGALLLCAALAAISRVLRGRPRAAASIHSVEALGLRAASFRPGRSLVCIALVAAAAFVIVAVGAFRHRGLDDLRVRSSESGGFSLMATSTQPLHHDLRTSDGRAALGLPDEGPAARTTIARFRRAAGEDASCLNLYRPARPTVLGAEPSFLREGRFTFQSALASSAAEKANPWLLLEQDAAGGAIPVVADATTLRYALGKRVGDEMALADTGVRLRFVGALRPGLLQGAVVTSERHFQRAFPDEEGFRFFLLDVPAGSEAAVTEALESRLSDFGFDVTDAADRLRALHRVEDTYIATFQTLGALGLLLGTIGLAAVLLRNAFERRRELALLQAVGYERGHLRRLVLAENALLLGLGLGGGLVPALVATAPALRERAGGPPLVTVAAVAAALLLVGAVVSIAAVAAIRRLPVLASLRSE